jgi:hypothetical protein
MEQRKKPQGVKLNILNMAGLVAFGLAIGGALSFWWPGAFLFSALVIWVIKFVIQRAGGPEMMAHRTAWLIYRARHLKAYRKRLKTEAEILAAAQAENMRTGTTVKERFDKEIKQIKQKEFEQARRWQERKRRWFK